MRVVVPPAAPASGQSARAQGVGERWCGSFTSVMAPTGTLPERVAGGDGETGDGGDGAEMVQHHADKPPPEWVVLLHPVGSAGGSIGRYGPIMSYAASLSAPLVADGD